MKKKIRKPRPISNYSMELLIWGKHTASVHIAWAPDAKGCRRLAAWLLKAAEYLEQGKKKI